MPKVLAVVVSFNRRDLLVRCLEALQSQSRVPDRIMVVDNGSTDGSREMVLADFAEVELIPLVENVGGAGGFSHGVDRAIGGGYDWAWLMDDDAAPEEDALAHLLEASACGDVPFVAPSVVNDVDGAPLRGHERRSVRLAPGGRDGADAASFVGVLISVAHARSEALPLADFFILHDDLEYTARLARTRPGVFVRDARIRHPDKPEMRDLGWRLYPEVRNQIWLARISGLGATATRRGRVRAVIRRLAGQALHSRDKVAYARCVTRAIRDGLLHAPRMEQPSGGAVAFRPRFVVRP